MLVGEVRSIAGGGLRAIVRVDLDASSGSRTTLDAALDTGFTGYLKLPRTRVEQLGLKRIGAANVSLADDRKVQSELFLASVRFGGKSRIAVIHALGTRALVGMQLLKGFRLEVGVFENGPVTLVPPQK